MIAAGVIGAGEWCDGCGVLITFGSRGHSVVRCGDIDRIGRDSLATEHPLSIEANNPRKLDCYVWEWDVISLSRSSHDTGMCTGDLITNNSSNNT